MIKNLLAIFTLLCFFLSSCLGPLPLAHADDFLLPTPGVMVRLSPPVDPIVLKGIKVDPANPFKFQFLLDKGDSDLSEDALKGESQKLIKYFLAALTIPDKDLWVNLSPYEQNRIIPYSFGLTEMGRDLLAEDYLLKQITASLIYPQDEVGKKFWKRIYEEAERRYGTTNIPVNTFNKVWIVPQKAVVFENAKEGAAYVVDSKLKVMLEQDYLSLKKHNAASSTTSSLASQIVREIVLPELTTEVNDNKNFVRLRQVYNSLILAEWYKTKIKNSILNQVYSDKDKVLGVNIKDPQEKNRIYQRYLKAFKKGVYNYIKEDADPITQEIIPRKYFSGGVDFEFGRTSLNAAAAMTVVTEKTASPVMFAFLKKTAGLVLVLASLTFSGMSNAQTLPIQQGINANSITQQDQKVINEILRKISTTNYSVDDQQELRQLGAQLLVNYNTNTASLPQMMDRVLTETFREARQLDPTTEIGGYSISEILSHIDHDGIEPQDLPSFLRALVEEKSEINRRVDKFLTTLEDAKANNTGNSPFFTMLGQSIRTEGMIPGDIYNSNADSIFKTLQENNHFIKDIETNSEKGTLTITYINKFDADRTEIMTFDLNLLPKEIFNMDNPNSNSDWWMGASIVFILAAGTLLANKISRKQMQQKLKNNLPSIEGQYSVQLLKMARITDKYQKEWLNLSFQSLDKESPEEEQWRIKAQEELEKTNELIKKLNRLMKVETDPKIKNKYRYYVESLKNISTPVDMLWHKLDDKIIGIRLLARQPAKRAQIASTFLPKQTEIDEIKSSLSNWKEFANNVIEQASKKNQTSPTRVLSSFLDNYAPLPVDRSIGLQAYPVMNPAMTGDKLIDQAMITTALRINTQISTPSWRGTTAPGLGNNLARSLSYDQESGLLFKNGQAIAPIKEYSRIFRDHDTILRIYDQNILHVNIQSIRKRLKRTEGLGLGVKVLSDGFIGNPQDGVYFMATERWVGEDLSKKNELSEDEIELLEKTLKTLILSKSWMEDIDADQFFIGRPVSALHGPLRIMLDADMLEPVSSSIEELTQLYIHFARSIKDAHAAEEIASYLENDFDFAMTGNPRINVNKNGGIDLTPAMINLQTLNAGQGIKFHIDTAMLQRLQNSPGFSPVVTNIQPLQSLPKFLGIQEITGN